MKIKLLIPALVCCCFMLQAQNLKTNWWNPQSAAFQVIEGQAWAAKDLKNPYDRLPAKAEKQVREAVWNLSNQSAGLMIRFRSNSPEIRVRYTVGGKHALPHMPATGVSGVDLYAVSSDGAPRWCAGKYAFGDTITYNFKLAANDNYHKKGREYRLFLPLYNSVKWLEIGTQEGADFTPLPVRPDKPIVVYGTSIAQGACASRPGMAWTSIVGRKMDRPLINLAFSGNGRLEKEVVDLVNEIDAHIFILDCLPNLTIRPDSKMPITAEEVRDRILATVKSLRQKHPQTPIALAEHAGYTDDEINPESKHFYEEVNVILRAAFAQLKSEGISNLFIIPKKHFNQDIETTVDGTHQTDLGMMRYAEGYEKHLRSILHEYTGEASTTKPITQLRELNNYDWEVRHREILEMTKKSAPETVVIGNSITHFWGGLPKGPRAVSDESWNETFGRKCVNLGYGWDRIENVLWRVYHGELSGFETKRIYVNIGTNNLHLNLDKEIVEGWKLLIAALKYQQPNAQITMLGIYPRRDQEVRVAALNGQLAQLAGEESVGYMDPGKVLLTTSGKTDETLFSDGLHPNAKGYTLLGNAIKQYIK